MMRWFLFSSLACLPYRPTLSRIIPNIPGTFPLVWLVGVLAVLACRSFVLVLVLVLVPSPCLVLSLIVMMWSRWIGVLVYLLV